MLIVDKMSLLLYIYYRHKLKYVGKKTMMLVLTAGSTLEILKIGQ
jgi:hypothetical protein